MRRSSSSPPVAVMLKLSPKHFHYLACVINNSCHAWNSCKEGLQMTDLVSQSSVEDFRWSCERFGGRDLVSWLPLMYRVITGRVTMGHHDTTPLTAVPFPHYSHTSIHDYTPPYTHTHTRTHKYIHSFQIHSYIPDECCLVSQSKVPALII